MRTYDGINKIVILMEHVYSDLGVFLYAILITLSRQMTLIW